MECKIILTVGGGAVFTVGLIIGQIIFLERSHGPHSESAQILAVDNLPFEDRFFICWRGNTASISLERHTIIQIQSFFLYIRTDADSNGAEQREGLEVLEVQVV